MKGYKALNSDFTGYNSYKFEIGKTYNITGDLIMCKNGFHFCKNIIDIFGYYDFNRDETIVVEVEALGDIIQEGTKFCTNKIKIKSMVDWDYIDSIIDGSHNSGRYNSGDCNSGDYNSGSYNSGSHNSGSRNSGSFNSGSHNSGWYNSGSHNSGWYNSGSRNSGSHNSGSHNSGSHNSGWYNSGRYNSGFFNSDAPTVRLFNSDSGMTFDEFYSLGINLNALETSKGIIQNLPNYDAQIFYDTTGIDWRADEEIET